VIVEILLGLTLILLGVGSILDGFIIIGLLLLPMGIFLLARNGAPGRVWVEQILKFLNDMADEFFMIVDGGSNRSASALTTRERQQQSPPAAADDSPRQRIFKHALLALRLSGHDPDRIGILPVDIGLMAFSAHKMPEIYRTRSVPSDVDYIQPFIVLNLPTGAVGRVRFELIDADEEVVFIHEDIHDLEAGSTLISPAARLRMRDEYRLDGLWTLQVFTDNLLLATHLFNWDIQHQTYLRRHLRDDGELGPEIRIMLAESRLQRMSLEELLAPQTEDDQSMRARRSL